MRLANSFLYNQGLWEYPENLAEWATAIAWAFLPVAAAVRFYSSAGV
jgi:hypothetical protein